MPLRLSRLISLLHLALLAACGPDKDTGVTDSSSSSDPTSTSTATSDPTSTGETASASTSSTGGPPSTSGTTNDASTSATDPGTSTTTTTTGVVPAGPCEERRTMEACLATDDGGGHNDCAWQPEFAEWSERSGCGAFAGPARCLPVHYQGDGCEGTSCPSQDNIYFRQLGPGLFELMNYGGCELQPDGWTQCSGLGDDPPACACFC